MEKNKALCRHACARYRSAPDRCDRARRHVLHRDWGHDRLEAGDRSGARDQLRRALACAPVDARTLRLYLASFAGERWRALARRLLGRPQPKARNRVVQPASPPPGANAVSLVHDTTYRRLRRGLVARMHGLDGAVSRQAHRRKRILFEAASPMSFAIFRPIYERLKQDPRVELWFTSYGTVWEPHQIFGRHGITENVVRRAAAAWLKVDAYVHADFWDMTWLHRRTRRIHLFHGVAGKYQLDAPVDLAPTIAAFDCVMFVNTDRRERYVEAGLVPDDDLRAPLVGYPKLDCLVNGSLDRVSTARALALDPAVPTIIYAPTWSPYSSLNAMGLEIIERLTAEGLQVIVKLHDRSYDARLRGSGGVAWAQRLSRYERHPLVRVAREPDGSPFMAVSDAMVSDHSSIAFEYMLLDRPLVVVDRPALIEHARVSLDKVRRLRAAADVVVAPHEITAAILYALQRPDRLSAERRRTAGDLFYEPGTATDRALALIYRLIELPAMAAISAAAEPGRELATVG
jgi:hypothetical protein